MRPEGSQSNCVDPCRSVLTEVGLNCGFKDKILIINCFQFLSLTLAVNMQSEGSYRDDLTAPPGGSLPAKYSGGEGQGSGGVGLAGDHLDQALDFQLGGAFLDAGQLHFASVIKVGLDGLFFFGT